jgi:hypothetical protein
MQHLRDLQVLLLALCAAPRAPGGCALDPAELRGSTATRARPRRPRARADDPPPGQCAGSWARRMGQYRMAERRGVLATAAAWTFPAWEVPRTIRREWRLLALSFGLVYGPRASPSPRCATTRSRAPPCTPPLVEAEFKFSSETADGEPFRGNSPSARRVAADRGLDHAPQHARRRGLLRLRAVPSALSALLATNGLMLGTYTAVAGHWGRPAPSRRSCGAMACSRSKRCAPRVAGGARARPDRPGRGRAATPRA